MKDLENKKKELLHAIIDAERENADKIIIAWANKNSYSAAFTLLFEPVLAEIGKMWEKNNLSLAQGYLAGKVAEDVFQEALKSKEFLEGNFETKGNVVIGNIEDDFHSLGRKLLSIFLRSKGWTVHDLGNDVSAAEFVDKAVEVNARIIGVSAMMYSTAKNIIKVRNEIDTRGLTGKIQLAAGGAIFKLRNTLLTEVGGDGTADNAMFVSDLFDQLWKKSLDYGK